MSNMLSIYLDNIVYSCYYISFSIEKATNDTRTLQHL
jgi:hypothetical protein